MAGLSSRMSRILSPVCALLLLPGIALAQEVKATPDAAATAAQHTGPIDLTITSQRRPARCGSSNGKGEIVVCGSDHGEDVRVPSTTDSDPHSREAQNTGVPHAPNVSGLPDCSRGCIGLGKGPPIIYVIDVKAIPEAPRGSDADKVANGEISDR